MFSRNHFQRGWSTLGSIQNSFSTFCDSDEDNTPSLVEQVTTPHFYCIINFRAHTAVRTHDKCNFSCLMSGKCNRKRAVSSENSNAVWEFARHLAARQCQHFWRLPYGCSETSQLKHGGESLVSLFWFDFHHTDILASPHLIESIILFPCILFSYWMGASQIPVPIYQYRIILPFDDKVINVATDMDFNVEGDLKAPLSKNVLAKSSFLVFSWRLFTILSIRYNSYSLNV